MLHRRRGTFAASALAVLATTAAPLLAATPAAAAAAPRLSVRGATVELGAPAQNPLTDDCFAGWSSSNCGFGKVTADLTGFDAFGGIPSCDPEDATYSEECELPIASLVQTAGTKVDVVVRCAGKWLPRVASVPVDTVPDRAGVTDVSAFNRTSSDSARVSILFYFPTPSQLRVCGGAETRVLSAAARSITVGWASESGAVPAGSARIAGVHRFPVG
ncbi:hypothetical protein GTQ99_14090 [Kineococcus sp. T13]|uniref:hypothetical protein n=1 Tax=Kineococcus vitellinus TaxID=2696565 RepID=UPI001412B3A6|nr:hypothetical protein [Kineococcus vitellinus]NAZ76537.1 hypothetical protein [Kineococcus vitellinus]